MLKISKSSIPTVLRLNGQQWLQELNSKKAAGESLRPIIYDKFKRNKEIKETIIKDSYAKCSYCESKMLAVSHGDIDHVVPLDTNHALAFDWLNLILSCTKCNHGKLNYFSQSNPLMNPLHDEPAEHLYPEEHWIRAIPSTKGPITEQKIKFNRGGLIEKRQEQLKSLQDSITFWTELKAQNDSLRELAKAQILSAQDRNSEYLFMKSNYIKNHCNDLWNKGT